MEETLKITSDSLHNKNCFSYLKHLKLTDSVLQRLSPNLANNLKTIQAQTAYDAGYAYADIYTDFFTEVEKNIETIYDEPKSKHNLKVAQLEILEENKAQEDQNTYLMRIYEKSLRSSLVEINELDDFIYSIYNNDNGILEDTFTVIRNIPLNHTPMNPEIAKSISSVLKDEGDRINKRSQSPAQAGSMVGRFTAMISDNFKPQHTTSLATVRKYNYTNQPTSLAPREYRYGTQGQRDNGLERASPLYKRWLKVQAERTPDKKITHIYFNNLGLDRTDTEGKKERALTHALHQLEEEHTNVAVITLPADKGLMAGGDYKKTKDSYSRSAVYDEFLKIANQDPSVKSDIKDFYISDNVRKLVFSNNSGTYTEEEEKRQLKELLDSSFKAMGLEEKTSLSSAEKQAVWFHFIKFELPNHIIQKLEPESINFSCKDAIDRGGVSSAYYNLNKSFEEDNIPLNREEFDRALHAAPAMVKARGINHHLNIIWNAVDAYVNANYDKLENNKEKAWLIEWRDSNCPHARVKGLLTLRIEQGIQKLEKAKASYLAGKHPAERAINNSLQILEQIKLQKDIGVSGNRLLLEAAIRTPEIALHPSKTKAQAYDKLADKLVIHSPFLQKLAGMMKILAGVILYPLSFGHTKNLINSGIATFKAGVESSQRKEIQYNMKEQLHSLKEQTLVEDKEDVEDPDSESRSFH